MNVTEMLQIADRLVFSQTGKHLDDTQEAVVKGVLRGQTYEKIAEECDRSESRIRDVAYKLWKILSEELDEEIHKSNFRSTLERLQVKSSSIITDNNHNFNDYSYSDQPLINSHHQKTSDDKVLYCDLKQSPKINNCYGRDKEIFTLNQWLANPNTRMISVLGIAGIGKSTLVRYFLEINTQSFDIIIWKNLKLYLNLQSTIRDILNQVKPNIIKQNSYKIDNTFKQLLELINHKRCLIILDNLEEIFIPEQFAGHYQAEFDATFLSMIAEIEHQSCLILISQEKCQAMISLEDKLDDRHCLELSGLDQSATQILKNQGLQSEEIWLDLIKLYQGNPEYLQSISSLIKDIFNGQVSNFLRKNTVIITEEIKSSLTKIYSRLSPIERQIILELSRYQQAQFKKDIEQSLSLPLSDLINGLQSLNRRCLIEKNTVGDDMSFNLAPFFREYIASLSNNIKND